MTETEALKLALEALEKTQNEGYNLPGSAIREAITAIKAALEAHKALAQPEYQSTADKSKLERVSAKGTLLAQPAVTESHKQEPACCEGNCPNKKECSNAMQCLYTTPTQRTAAEGEDKRTWVGLTKEEVSEIAAQGHQRWLEFYYAIEAKLKAKNFASSEGFKEKNT